MNRQATVLIVEDEPAIADTLQYALETEGFVPLIAPTGRDALDFIDQMETHVIALIILDIGLPDINGLELCRQIRQKSAVPIIFLTARNEEIDRVVGLEIGGDDYVVKPFSPRELTARVKAVLRRTCMPVAAAAASPQVWKQIWKIDSAKRRICYFDKPLELSRTEYDLLHTLIRRPGRVFTREQLMALAWDEPEASMDRTVDAHIKNLRAKLREINPAVDPIITHRGTGYALREDREYLHGGAL